MNFYINKNLDTPIYCQIADQITDAICKGIIKPGDRLPAQRDLSAGLNISRGSIQKAYEDLEKNGIVEIIKGSGCYVTKVQEIQEQDRKGAAVTLIDKLLDKLYDLNFTSKDIRAFMDIRIIERENQHNSIRIAAIDCNPEALEIFKIQISTIKNTHFRMFILDDILKYSQPDKIFEDYDIIITTLNHYDELSRILYTLREKLFKVAVSPTSDTIIKIATISKAFNVGLITRSAKFRDIVYKQLRSFNLEEENVEHIFNTDIKAIKKFLRVKDYLIIPQSYDLLNSAYKEELQDFVNRGGDIIEFKYQIDRGSLIYIDEQINNILHSR
jgi:DNA-binding transcriptional regulator YhcF (GntR family)